MSPKDLGKISHPEPLRRSTKIAGFTKYSKPLQVDYTLPSVWLFIKLSDLYYKDVAQVDSFAYSRNPSQSWPGCRAPWSACQRQPNCWGGCRSYERGLGAGKVPRGQGRSQPQSSHCHPCRKLGDYSLRDTYQNHCYCCKNHNRHHLQYLNWFEIYHYY